MSNSTNPFDAMQSPYAKAFDAVSKDAQYTAGQTQFDESKGVAGRVSQITAKDSPLMQRAQAKAAEQQNKRGTLNSSMAIGAAQAAVIDAATPIAQADAQLYQTTQIENTKAANQAAAQNAQVRMQSGLDAIRTTESGRQFDANLAWNKDQFGKTFGLEKDKLSESQRQFNVSSQLERDKLEQNASQFARQMGLEYDKMAESDKQQLRQLAMEQSRLKESARQFDTGQVLERDRLGETRRQFDTEQSNAMSRFDRELAEKSRQFNADQASGMAKLDKELASRAGLAELDARTKTTIAQMDANTRKEVATLENNWRLELSRNEKIAGAWGTVMDKIGAIQNNKDLSEGTKRELIQQNLDLFKGFASFSQKLGGSPVDVSDLLDFSTGGGGRAAGTVTGGGSVGGGSAVDAMPGGYRGSKLPNDTNGDGRVTRDDWGW